MLHIVREYTLENSLIKLYNDLIRAEIIAIYRALHAVRALSRAEEIRNNLKP